MNFKEAAAYRLTFGRYVGMAVDECAEDDEGLRWLDWMRGEARSPHLKLVLDTYLSDPTIAKELADVLDTRHVRKK
jgi:hypothetical protein